MNKFTHNIRIHDSSIKVYLKTQQFLENKWIQHGLFFALGLFLFDPLFATVDGDMKASVEDLQKEIFGSGWVTVGKIGAAATGVVMSVAKMNMIPFIIGGLSSGGIHFFQKHTAAAAACLM